MSIRRRAVCRIFRKYNIRQRPSQSQIPYTMPVTSFC